MVGDGIGWRTLPGTDHPAAAYFVRGSGHNEKAQYTERPDDYVHNMERLVHKFETARTRVPKSIGTGSGREGVGILAYGTSHWAIIESRDQLRSEHGLETDYLRVRGYPFPRDVQDFVERHERIYVVEQNRDGQLFDLLRLDLPTEQLAKLRSIAHCNGLPLDARSVTDELIAQEGN